MKRALITGITGQDGSYLAELLLDKGYEVVGATSGNRDRQNVERTEHRVTWAVGDVANECFVRELVSKYRPCEIYNFASVATVAQPWHDTVTLAHITALTPLYFLSAIRTIDPAIRFFQASSAEMYGATKISPQNEQTSFAPQNAYGVAKLFAHQMLHGYRVNHGLFAVSGILFNHESPRRPEQFVSRKITSALSKLKLGILESFALGNLDAKRDWGFAGDYVRAIYLTLQHKEASDYVIATGESHTVREFVDAAANSIGMPIHWCGTGLHEIGKTSDGRTVITIASEFYRPLGENILVGDSRKARQMLNWEPNVGFVKLAAMMAYADLERLSKKGNRNANRAEQRLLG